MPWSDSGWLVLIALAAATAATVSVASAQRPAASDVPLPPEAGAPSGPAATSGMGAARYDQVGLAREWSPDTPARNAVGAGASAARIAAAHRRLRAGAVAEVTSLDTGRTILVLIEREAASSVPAVEIELSPAAAAMLGVTDRAEAPVRVRGVVASAADVAELRAGRPAARRLDAPPALVAALREQLKPASSAPERIVATPVSESPDPSRARVVAARPLTRPVAAPRQPAPGKHLVQVAALSNEARARALARTLGGHVESAGQLHRIRLGPFADVNSAQRARDAAKRRGYGDATIITQP